MEYLAVLVPSIGIGILFWFIMRWIFRADSTERKVSASAEEDARAWYEQVKERGREEDSFRERKPRRP